VGSGFVGFGEGYAGDLVHGEKSTSGEPADGTNIVLGDDDVEITGSNDFVATLPPVVVPSEVEENLGGKFGMGGMPSWLRSNPRR
jgi:hypothetical protein